MTPVMEQRTGLGSAGWQEEGEVQVASVSRGMPAEKAGLKKGDLLLSANGQPIRSLHRLHEVINAAGGKPVQVDYSRDNKEGRVSIQPVFTQDPPNSPARWMIGVLPQPRMVMTQLAFPAALRESVQQNLKNATLIYQFLRGIVERRMSAKSIEGPIGISRMAGDAAREGAVAFFALMAIVSLNLAVFNLLPIPILDGGVIVLLLVEMLMRRDLSLRVKETVFKQLDAVMKPGAILASNTSSLSISELAATTKRVDRFIGLRVSQDEERIGLLAPSAPPATGSIVNTTNRMASQMSAPVTR